VGEVVTTSNFSASVTSATQTYPILASKVLQPGIWLPVVTAVVAATTPTTLSEAASLGVSTDSSPTTWTDRDLSGRSNYVISSLSNFASSSNIRMGIYGALRPIVVTTATTYYIKDQNRVSSGQLDYTGSVTFVRIA
jgi:hypothetical protein